jgi:hypothetical protein
MCQALAPFLGFVDRFISDALLADEFLPHLAAVGFAVIAVVCLSAGDHRRGLAGSLLANLWRSCPAHYPLLVPFVRCRQSEPARRWGVKFWLHSKNNFAVCQDLF